VIASAAKTELVATERFSARMASEPNSDPMIAGDPTMIALSLRLTLTPRGRTP
jgi:hypothetical protein